MGYKNRRYACVDCGRPTERFRRSYDPKICVDCGVNRLITNSLLMKFKTGVGYSKWLASNGPYGRPRK